ncbi:MAG TPA: LytTR family DNA-binding domain-containing protein [Flavisolibacter sp.]|jgi:two-component system LytT family response regulator|nr:LytTR family DNA-binding domain-containing protein [Flavisolibacter sp.]
MNTQTTAALPKTFLLQTDRGTQCILVEDVLRIEAISNYSKLYFTNGKTLVVARVLRRFDECLKKNDFVRIHHKHLVNRRWIQSVQLANQPMLLLHNGEAVFASRRRKAILKTLLLAE